MSFKRFVFVFVILVLSLNNNIYSQNNDSLALFRVQDISFENIMLQSKKENKLIFIDFYTVWCGPCKIMDNTTFKDAAIIKDFNKKYISYKVNAESEKGMPLAQRYHIDAYPSFLFISPEGIIVNRLEGVYTAEMLFDQAKFAEKYWADNK